MSDVVAGLLERALESFERYEDEEALQRLLEAWRESRAERLVQLMARLSGVLPSGLAPPVGPVELPRMFEGLVATAGQRYRQGLGPELRDFRRWPADPRLTPGLLALAAMPVAQQEEVFLPLCELLVHVRDPRALGPLRALHASLPPESPYARRLDISIGLIAVQIVTPLGVRASARCDALEDAISRREEAVARSAPLREALLAR
ncbi:MAG TPA: hypothetical protein VE153_15420, partial [Myxococcus sp.]|nr:hypothetical protein [Myxococcus sp.]